MKGKRRNLGNQLDEIMKMKEKAERETRKLSRDYPEVAMKVAKEVLVKLQKEIDKVQNSREYDTITFADSIYKILIETNYKSLEQTKEDYDIWSDLNDKFNS